MAALGIPVHAAGEAAQRTIRGQGTFERAWQAWAPLARLGETTVDALAPGFGRVVVIAPHPDDEVLGCGGTLARLATAGREVRVISVTDGEASHRGSQRWSPARLAQARRRERARGLARLGLGGDCVSLAFADGAIAAREHELVDALQGHVRPGDVVFTTWRQDGHPDHEAVGRAAATACAGVGCVLREMPIWMWHWAEPGDPRVPWNRLERVALDDDARMRKRLALSAHTSQIKPDGSRPAVLPIWVLARLLRPFEYFFSPQELP